MISNLKTRFLNFITLLNIERLVVTQLLITQVSVCEETMSQLISINLGTYFYKAKRKLTKPMLDFVFHRPSRAPKAAFKKRSSPVENEKLMFCNDFTTKENWFNNFVSFVGIRHYK